MRKENAGFRTAFLSEEGSRLYNRDYFAYVELDSFACYVAADSLDAERAKNSAQIVVECILREFMEHPSMSVFFVRRSLRKAHRALLADTDGCRLRASVSMIVTNYVKFRYASVGNARFALLRNGRILYESRDQSLTENLVEQEEVPKDKAALHEERNNLYACLGQSAGWPKLQISRKKKMTNGDIMALYTRGVWENCSEAEFLEAAKEVSTPQELSDNIEDQILGKKKPEIDNYTIAVTFVDKVYLNPKKRWTLKKVLAIVLPVVLVLIVLGVILVVRQKIRAGWRENMQKHLESAERYVSYDNYEKASEEYQQAKELAENLKAKEEQEQIEGAILLAGQILMADQSLADGNYEEAQEQYRKASVLSKGAGGSGLAYIEKQLDKTEDYMELFELIASGETKEGYGDFAGAAELYRKARKMAAALYDQETKAEALEKQRSAEEALEQLRQEELGELEKNIQEAIEDAQVAQELENQSLMNDKQNALELESKGNDLMKSEDYQSAVAYFETAQNLYAALDMPQRVQALEVQIEACKKLAEEAKQKAAAEAAEQSAQEAAAQEAKDAAEEARQAAQDLKDAQTSQALEEAQKAAEEAQKAAEEAKRALEESKNRDTESGTDGSRTNGTEEDAEDRTDGSRTNSAEDHEDDSGAAE